MNRRKLRQLDTAAFSQAIASGDDLTMVLVGQIHLEALLNIALGARVDPESDLVEGLTLNQRVDLAILLGLLRPELRLAWRLVFALRNRFAHEFQPALTADDARRLRSAIPTDVWASAPDASTLSTPAHVSGTVAWALVVLYSNALNQHSRGTGSAPSSRGA